MKNKKSMFFALLAQSWLSVFTTMVTGCTKPRDELSFDTTTENIKNNSQKIDVTQELPWVVLVDAYQTKGKSKEPDMKLTGFFVSPRVILVPAHGIVGFKKWTIGLREGRKKRKITSFDAEYLSPKNAKNISTVQAIGKTIQVSRGTFAPHDPDVGVIYLDEKDEPKFNDEQSLGKYARLVLSEEPNAIVIQSRRSSSTINFELVAFGRGLNGKVSTIDEPHIHGSNTIRVDDSIYKDYYVFENSISDPGDSGGPLLIYDSKTTELSNTVRATVNGEGHFGAQCFSLFTRIDTREVLDWIVPKVNAHGGFMPGYEPDLSTTSF